MIDNIIADSSFYICFLNDIDSPATLEKVLDHFTVHISKRILDEIKSAKNINTLLSSKKEKINIFEDAPFDFGQITKPLFSKSEITKGEHEVVVIAYFFYNLGLRFILIIDEHGVRNFVTKNLPYLTICLRGTVGFVTDCCCEHKIFSKKEALLIIEKIKNSKFRVTSQILDSANERLEAYE